jgi:hypothetical protein
LFPFVFPFLSLCPSLSSPFILSLIHRLPLLFHPLSILNPLFHFFSSYFPLLPPLFLQSPLHLSIFPLFTSLIIPILLLLSISSFSLLSLFDP